MNINFLKSTDFSYMFDEFKKKSELLLGKKKKTKTQG